MLDLEAAIHDHGEAAATRDRGSLSVDHAELQPECAGADGDCLLGDGRDGPGARKTSTTSIGSGTSESDG